MQFTHFNSNVKFELHCKFLFAQQNNCLGTSECGAEESSNSWQTGDATNIGSDKNNNSIGNNERCLRVFINNEIRR